MSTFSTRIRIHVQRELDAAARAEAQGDLPEAARRLERAHVLGQRSTREHVRVHIAMGRFALRQRNLAAAWGQAWRAAFGGVLTPLGLVPGGNTGSSAVSAFRRMPIDHELQQLIDEAGR